MELPAGPSLAQVDRWRVGPRSRHSAGRDPSRRNYRDTVVHFKNNSDSALTLKSDNLDSGCWSSGGPPQEKIAIDQSVDIASESCGILTGTEFHVSYTLDLNGATMSMHYDNPEAGRMGVSLDRPTVMVRLDWMQDNARPEV
jgi:hypothetical protein